jgi:hypothetical protein
VHYIAGAATPHLSKPRWLRYPCTSLRAALCSHTNLLPTLQNCGPQGDFPRGSTLDHKDKNVTGHAEVRHRCSRLLILKPPRKDKGFLTRFIDDKGR